MAIQFFDQVSVSVKKFTVSYYIQERTLQVVSSRISEPLHSAF